MTIHGKQNTRYLSSLNNVFTLIIHMMIQNNLRKVTMADINRILLISDTNGDMKISLKELNVCTLRMRIELEQRGVDFDEDRFKTLVNKDNDISQVLKVIAAILFEELIDDTDLNEYTLDAMEDEARKDSFTSTIRVAGHLKLLGRGFTFDEEDAHLFVLQDRYTVGSVEVARGNRTTLSRATSSRQDSSRSRSSSIIQRYTVEMKEQNEKGRERIEKQKGDRHLTASMIMDSLQRDDFVQDLSASMIRDGSLERNAIQNSSSFLVDDYDETQGARDLTETDWNTSLAIDNCKTNKKAKKKNKKSKKKSKKKNRDDAGDTSPMSPDD